MVLDSGDGEVQGSHGKRHAGLIHENPCTSKLRKKLIRQRSEKDLFMAHSDVLKPTKRQRFTHVYPIQAMKKNDLKA